MNDKKLEISINVDPEFIPKEIEEDILKNFRKTIAIVNLLLERSLLCIKGECQNDQ